MIDGSTDAHARPGASPLRVGLTLGAIVLGAVVVFGLGVMEGSRVVELAPVTAAPPGSLTAPSAAPAPSAPVVLAAATPADKLTFYDRLSGVTPAPPPALPEGQAPLQVLVPATPAARELPLPPPETRSPALAAGASARKVAAPAPAEVAARSTVPSKSDPSAKIRKLVGKGRFTVQVAAVGERAAAAETAALVKRNGFDAVTVMASVKGKIWYRIRVGSFPSKQAATQAAGIFHSAFGLNAIAVEN